MSWERIAIAIWPSSTDHRGRRQRGQATVEFAFALIGLIALIAGLYQALHFELDVFNRLNLLRYRAVRLAHRDQLTVTRRYVPVVATFQPVAEVTPIRVPFQTADLSIRYGPKTFYVRQGAKWKDPLESPWTHDTGRIFVELLSAHQEYTKGAFFWANYMPRMLPTQCSNTSFYGTPGTFMTTMACDFVDAP